MTLPRMSFAVLLAMALCASLMEAKISTSVSAYQHGLEMFETRVKQCQEKDGWCTLTDFCDGADVVVGDGLCPRLDVVCCLKKVNETVRFCLEKENRICSLEGEGCGAAPEDIV